MKICKQCRQHYPDHARYCMNCGTALEALDEKGHFRGQLRTKGWNVFWLTLGGSLLLSWLLVAVLHLPVFIIGAFLPLLWYSRKS